MEILDVLSKKWGMEDDFQNPVLWYWLVNLSVDIKKWRKNFMKRRTSLLFMEIYARHVKNVSSLALLLFLYTNGYWLLFYFNSSLNIYKK